MKINDIQRHIIAFTLILILIACLFPPWCAGSSKRFWGWALLFAPGTPDNNWWDFARPDYSILGLEIFILLVLSALLLFLFKK